ncbi:tape measure protein [Paludibaculum fermentans]|uniref:tape measure protein n=1 Tax=Paludibaculum fermentans TaxID=1473598 RepID=UPI003EB71F82
MANTLGDLIVKVGAQVDGYQDSMLGVLATAEKTVKGVETKFANFDKLGDRLTGLGTKLSAAISLPLIGAGALAVKSAMDMESLEMALRGVAGSAEETQAQMKRLIEVSKLPGLGLEEAIRASVNLQSAGLSAQQAERYIKAFGNALAGVGKGKAELQSVIEQLRQMSAKSKVTADDLKPLMNATPQVAKVVKEAFGTIDTEALQKMGVSTSLFIETVVAGLEKLPAAGNTTRNTFENLQDAISRTSAQMGKNLMPLVQEIIPKIEGLTAKLGEMAEQFSKLDPATKSFWTNFAIGITVTPLIIAGIGGVVKVVKDLATAFAYLQGIGAFSLLFSPAGIAVLAGLGVAAVALKELNHLDEVGKAGTDRLYTERQKTAKAKDAELERQAAAAWAQREIEDGQKRAEAIQKQLAAQKGLTEETTKYYQPGHAKLELSIQERAELDLIGQRYTDAKKWLDAYYTSKALDKQLTSELLQIGAGFRTELSAQTAEYAKQVTSIDQVAAGLEKMLRANAKLTDLELPKGMKVSYDETTEAMFKYETRLKELNIKTNEVMKGTVVQDAMKSTIAAYEAGAISVEEFRRVYEELLKVYNNKTGSGSHGQKDSVLKEISTIMTNMNQSIADAIVNWKGFGETAVNVLKQIGKAIIAEILTKMVLTKDRINSIVDVLGAGLKKIGLGKILGSGVDKAADIGSSATSSSASAASSASSSVGGIAGAVNMVSGIASAIGSLGTMFVTMKMNSKLYDIETGIRGMVGNSTGLNEQINEYLPALKGIEDRITQLITGGLGVYSFPDSEVRVRMADNSLVGAGGTMQVVVNGGYFMTDGALDSFTDAFIGRLRARGLKL